MDSSKVFRYHDLYFFTYFVTITTNYQFSDVIPIVKKFRKYIYNHDKNAHFISVKEYTTNFHGLHYHVLVFTNKRLDYFKIHKNMPRHADINIQSVPKTKKDIKNVYLYMKKSKK